MGKAGLNLLIVGINYAPEASGIAPYTAGMASALAQRGHVVKVVTTYPHYPSWRLEDDASRRVTREQLDGADVARVPHYVPRRPNHPRRALSEVTFGLSSVAQRWGHPDVVLSISPALLSSVCAMGRGRISRARPAVGIIAQDLYSAGLAETGGGSTAVRALSWVEAHALRAADGVAVIHERFRQRVVRSLNVDPALVRVIRNWTHLEEVPAFDRDAFRAQHGWDRDIVVLHTGAMGEKQDLRNVVEAGRISDSFGLGIKFVLVGGGSQRDYLLQAAQGVRAVEFHDTFTDDDYVRALRSADVLLVNERPGVTDMAVPSKLTSYFGAGVPVLAATDSCSTTAEEVTASGAGEIVAAGDPRALVDAAHKLTLDPWRAEEMGKRGLEYCAKVLSQSVAIDAYESWIFELHHRAQHRRGGR